MRRLGRVPFKGKSQPAALPPSPEALYRDLPRKPESVPGLWVHQGDLLREYTADQVDTGDLALELPTGTGKTLPGLLIADWVRRVRPARVAYACPTVQLARQVADTAEREGVPAVVLVRSHHDWPIVDQARYEAAEAVAIVTYSTVFNSSPKLMPPGLLVLDDAHAGEQYVAEQYAVDIRRRDQPDAYEAILAALSPALDGMLVQRLRDPSPDPGAHQQVRLVVPLRQPGVAEALDGVLARLSAPYCFRYAMIRGGLPACLVYLSYSGVLVRPLIPATSDNTVFAGARQRLYLSATLGDGGELERAFGRSGIVRLTLPATSPVPRSGRRFFVFPELVEGADPAALAAKIVALAGKALVLAPDTETAVSRAGDLAQPGWQVMTIGDVSEGMEPFAAAAHATCGLASRYDGLDLPGEACRAVVLEGKPDQDNLQDRFLSERVRAGAALAERIRTRVVQGAGRCTRGPNDWAVVVVLGADLTKYLLWPETQRALDPELQAEVQFGVENSLGVGPADVLDNVRVFLAQDNEWRANAEPLLAEYRHGADRVLPAGTDALAAAVGHEVEACGLAAAGKWADATRAAQEAARVLGTGGDATRGYRALWLYLAGTWADQAGVDAGTPALRRTARALIGQAEQAAKPGTWTRDLAPLPDAGREQLTPADAAAVAVIAAKIEAGVNKSRHDKAVVTMEHGLAQTTPALYEPALSILGTLLGADAVKPPGKGRCDSAWSWQDCLWLAIEAKSDEKPSGMIPHRDIRQANDQLRLLCADRHQDAPPAGSATIIVSPKPAVARDGIVSAEAHVHIISPAVITDLARDAAQAWDEILAGRAGHSGAALRELVTAALARHSVLPSQVLDRLTPEPVASRPA
jgi:hypothetical protein